MSVPPPENPPTSTEPVPHALPRGAPLVLIIRDGWGTNPHPEHDAFNAVRLARTPVADRLMAEWPWTLIKTSGEDVGLPEGTMGNSEVGHQNLGAGRIVDQESVAITKACRAGLEKNLAIAGAIASARDGGHGLHLMGICSDAGVHGQLDHLFALLKAAKALGMARERVFVHLFMDGRDTGPFTGLEFARRVERACAEIGIGRVATMCGRYFAMDRDNRWERVSRAYNVLTGRADAAHPAKRFPDVASAVQDAYDHPLGDNLRGDEFIEPRHIGPVGSGAVERGDSVIFYNYRGDRPRELCSAFVFEDEKWSGVAPSPDSGTRGFERGPRLGLDFVIMTDYWDALSPLCTIAFPKPAKMKNIAGAWVSELGMGQLRCAETEKYPHVTFFFNDYREPPFPLEVRDNPQSPKVATYDLQPQMSAREVCDSVLRRLAAPECPALLVVNFANADMVGHTGVLSAAITACETVDACVGEIVSATLQRGGQLIVTADHGNAEQMFDPETGSPHTAHTVYDVPLIAVGESVRGKTLRGDQDAAGWFKPEVRAGRGRLADVLPTAFAMLGLPRPEEMTGRSLVKG
ncbi:2,3-bisphosphoglycerate-independent phosphoglycerate mutase [soil metagenome]